MSPSNFYYDNLPRPSTWAKISDCISSIFLILSSISFLLNRSDGGVCGGVGVGVGGTGVGSRGGVGSIGVGSGGVGSAGTFNGDSGLEVITGGVYFSGESGAFTEVRTWILQALQKSWSDPQLDVFMAPMIWGQGQDFNKNDVTIVELFDLKGYSRIIQWCIHT